jgi:DNA modification methylase
MQALNTLLGMLRLTTNLSTQMQLCKGQKAIRSLWVNLAKNMPLRSYKTLSVGNLNRYEANSRTHSEEQIQQVVNSISEFGFTNPILIDENNTIIAGHCRLDAAVRSNMDTVPCIVLDGLTETQKRAYVIADNKLALNAGWNDDILRSSFEMLKDDGFNIELTGFSLDELDGLFPQQPGVAFCDEDECPDVPEEPIAKLGDIWLLGEHRLMCGDAVKLNDVNLLMNGVKADMVFTDPPYGINYSGRGLNTSTKIMNDNIDPTRFYNILTNIRERYIWGRIENYLNLLTKPRDVIIWKKNNFGMGSGYRGQYEVCFYYGNFKGSDSDVWEIDKDIKYEHPTQKPVALAERAIKNSKPKIVIDLFGGSGSTLIACEKTKRKCFMMELDPKYCDVIIKRYENYTGNTAVLET